MTRWAGLLELGFAACMLGYAVVFLGMGLAISADQRIGGLEKTILCTVVGFGCLGCLTFGGWIFREWLRA